MILSKQTDSLKVFIVQLYIVSVMVGQGISYWKIYLLHIAMVFMALLVLVDYKKFIAWIKLHSTYCFCVLSLIFLFSLSYLFANYASPISPIPCIQYLIGFSILIFVPYALTYCPVGQTLKLLSGLLLIHWSLSLLETFNLLRWPLSPYSQYNFFFLKRCPPGL